MKVRLDSDLCQGHGQCVFLCPEVFGADDQGFARLQCEDVPLDAEPEVEKAEASCPERAIRITLGPRIPRHGSA